VRRDHHPFWAERALDELNQAWARHFLFPQFDTIGAGARFLGPNFVEIQGPNVRVADHLHVFATRQNPVSICVDPYDGGVGHVNIGSYCVLSPGVRMRSAIGIDIGDNCMLAEGTYVTDADWHDAYHRIYPGKRKPIRLRDNVWIGDGVTICKGVTIGENSIIGACSVVTKDIPDNTIAAGNPAKPVGELDGDAAFSKREHLFAGGRPYQEYKDEYDRGRLQGNTLLGWARSRLWPTRKL